MAASHVKALQDGLWDGCFDIAAINGAMEELKRHVYVKNLVDNALLSPELKQADFSRLRNFIHLIFTDPSIRPDILGYCKQLDVSQLCALGTLLRKRDVPSDLGTLELLAEKTPLLPWYGDSRLFATAAATTGLAGNTDFAAFANALTLAAALTSSVEQRRGSASNALSPEAQPSKRRRVVDCPHALVDLTPEVLAVCARNVYVVSVPVATFKEPVRATEDLRFTEDRYRYVSSVIRGSKGPSFQIILRKSQEGGRTPKASDFTGVLHDTIRAFYHPEIGGAAMCWDNYEIHWTDALPQDMIAAARSLSSLVLQEN